MTDAILIQAPQNPYIKSRLDFMNLFTDAELEAIYSAAKTTVSVEVWLDKFKLADWVDLTDPRTVAGVQSLETAGLIATGRATTILGL